MGANASYWVVASDAPSYMIEELFFSEPAQSILAAGRKHLDGGFSSAY